MENGLQEYLPTKVKQNNRRKNDDANSNEDPYLYIEGIESLYDDENIEVEDVYDENDNEAIIEASEVPIDDNIHDRRDQTYENSS